MSLNKVLNRPMFRKEALKRGVLKPIKARTGRSIGPYRPPVPAVIPQVTPLGVPVGSGYNTGMTLRKQPGFLERFGTGAKRFARGVANLPAYYGFTGGMKVGEALGINDPVGQTVSGLGGAYAASRALPALAGIGLLPSAVGIATIEGIRNRVNAGIELRKKINAMSPAERKAFEIENRNNAFSYMGEGVSDTDLFGKFVPKPPKPIVTKKSAAPKDGPGSGRPSVSGNKSKELKAEGDPLLQDNVVNSDDIANLDSVQENAINVDSTGMPPGPPGSTDTLPTKVVDEGMTDSEKKTQKDESTAQGTNEIIVGGATNDPIFNQRIELAKKYTEELEKGQSSQAKLVFLANLASGLLTGTTKKSGIGGAMEVFGQAIGPAVNNYATIKLKEGELRAKRREAGLNAAFDHMKFLNDAAKEDVEVVERDRGVVQIRGVDGKLRNYKAYTRKDGTIEMASGGFDKNTGQEIFVPVAQGSDIKTSGPDGIPGNEDDVVIGKYEDFIPQKIYSKRLQEIEDILGNRYAALATTRDVLKTLAQTDADDQQVKAGAALSIDTFFRRATGVAKDILQIDLASEAKEAEAQAERFYQDEMNKIQDALDNGEITESQANGERKLIDKNNLKNQILKKIKKKGAFSGLSGADQEKLAVQEVTLVYALANTFKDQDRLTQRDINAAQKIVNIFSLARSSQDVRDSINAIGNQLEADINRQEIAYTRSGGLNSSLMDLRAQQNFVPFKEGQSIPQGLQTEFDTEEKIKKELEGIGL